MSNPIGRALSIAIFLVVALVGCAGMEEALEREQCAKSLTAKRIYQAVAKTDRATRTYLRTNDSEDGRAAAFAGQEAFSITFEGNRDHNYTIQDLLVIRAVRRNTLRTDEAITEALGASADGNLAALKMRSDAKVRLTDFNQSIIVTLDTLVDVNSDDLNHAIESALLASDSDADGRLGLIELDQAITATLNILVASEDFGRAVAGGPDDIIDQTSHIHSRAAMRMTEALLALAHISDGDQARIATLASDRLHAAAGAVFATGMALQDARKAVSHFSRPGC